MRLLAPEAGEAREFLVSVVSSHGSVTRATESGPLVRVEQPVADLEARFTAFLRPGTSDMAVWTQIIRDQQYAAVVRVLRAHASMPIETIIDLGANIGLATRYFSAAYPSARILAVEPGPENYRMLQRNTEDLQERVETLRAAFWPREEVLDWSEDPFRDGRSWSQAVGPTSSAERSADRAAIEVVTPRAALHRLGVERADLVKIDIEGAEAEFFTSAQSTKELTDMARAVAIEVHGETIDPVDVGLAFDKAGFMSVVCGELLICIRREYLR